MRFVRAAILGAALAATAGTAWSEGGYNQPPQAILDVMRAPSPARPIPSPTEDRILLVSWERYPSIARVATPYLRLAGVRIEPRNHSKHDTPGGYGITPCARTFELVQVAGAKQVPVNLAGVTCANNPEWSADGKHFSFENIATDSVELWIGDAQSGAVHRVPGVRLNPMFGDEVQWIADQRTLLVKLVPGDDPPPPKPDVPPGPSIQESVGQSGESSTYEARDTLNNAYDESLFEYYGASQLALVDIATGKVTRVGKPALYATVDPAPDGRHLLARSIHRPYSYVTTYDRFPMEVDVWDLRKPDLIAYHVASLPLADRVPIRGVRLGPRAFEWRSTQPASLYWAEALDNGDWKVKVPARDKVMMVKAPFDAAPREVVRTEQRYAGIGWGERPEVALLNEYDIDRHWRKTFLIDVDDPAKPRRTLWDMSYDDHYADPGEPVMRALASGHRVIRQDGDAIFLAGEGASPGGERPFLDRLDINTGKAERMFRCDLSSYERFLAFSPSSTQSFLTWRQSPQDPPNAFSRKLAGKVEAQAGEAQYRSEREAVTRLPDPTPILRQIKQRLVTYKRDDGVPLSFTLYTPPGYREGTRVPTIVYAYPLDYAEASTAGQVSGSDKFFTQLRGYQFLLLAGYAIVDEASFPIVGDPRKAYDTYLPQLVADAKAAVDEAVRLGVADPARLAVTGHSHGALMAANLAAHTDLFKAAAATSGSYNKTLTPFGFQNERRSVWEAPDVYLKVSPFFVADKIKTPLLIIHGADDANPGTTPLQGTKLYEAVRGNGGTTRLVMLPNEPHWYTARESNEQEVYELLTWFDRYVKGK